MRQATTRGATARWDLSVLVLANAAVVTGLWWRQGGLRDVHDLGGLLTSLGRLTGLLGAFLALLQLLLLARIPVVDRALGVERSTAWHRRNGTTCLALVLGHAVLVTLGYAIEDDVGVAEQTRALVADYAGMVAAVVASGLLVAVVATSVALVRRRVGHRSWRAVHLTVYVAIALAFSHQLATGHEFQHQPVARAYWIALYAATTAALVLARGVLPAARALRHGLRVERVVAEAPGVVSLEIGGRDLTRLGAQAGQFFHWRFLTPRLWWEAHPFSLSAAPDGRRLRITIKDLGDFSRRLAAVRPGTRVSVEGPCGGFTPARDDCRVALIAGGVGIAPVRALLEALPGDITVIYRAGGEDDVLFREELDELSHRRGAELHYVLGDPPAGPLSPEHLRALVPDIAARDVFLCGPPRMTRAARASLRSVGVPAKRIVMESFG